MTIRLYEPESRTRRLARLLRAHSVAWEPIDRSEVAAARLFGKGQVPYLEIDGELFIDPNDDAVEKILARAS